MLWVGVQPQILTKDAGTLSNQSVLLLSPATKLYTLSLVAICWKSETLFYCRGQQKLCLFVSLLRNGNIAPLKVAALIV